MNPAHKPWEDAHEKLLGTDTDLAIAKQLGRTHKAVESQRRKRGIAAFHARSRKWSKRELAMLGTISDESVAKKLDCTRKHVIQKRQALGVAAFSPKNTPKKFRKRRRTAKPKS